MRFYLKLYTKETMSLEITIAREAILECIEFQFSPLIAQQLELLLSKEELYSTMLQMAKGRSPRPDGITSEFFCKFLDLLGNDFQHMIEFSIQQGCLKRTIKPQG